MAMDGKQLIGRLRRLSQIHSVKDLPQLTHALFPGTHCPLMGAAMAVGGIRDGLLVVVGTDECTYYTKSMTIHSERFGGISGRCVSVVLDDRDVTFGSTQKMYDAFEDIMKEYQPKCVFLVTTCVVEIIGDDYDALADDLSNTYGIPVLPVHTEHFKCEDHFPGLERTITVCADMMEAQPRGNAVNILGQRMGDFATTELYRRLLQSGVPIGMQLPCGCTVDDIRRGPSGRVNIVVHDIALPLAKEMKKRFGIPYVHFDKFVMPDNIYQAYQTLYDALGLPLPDDVAAQYQDVKKEAEQAKAAVQGISYIYGNTPYYCFELNSFLTGLGMTPQIIQSNRFSETDESYVQDILTHTDPYVCKAANIAPLQYIYDELHPYIYMGHEFGDRLRRKGIAILHSDRAGGMLGFEVTSYLLRQLKEAIAEARTYREEAGL